MLRVDTDRWVKHMQEEMYHNCYLGQMFVYDVNWLANVINKVETVRSYLRVVRTTYGTKMWQCAINKRPLGNAFRKPTFFDVWFLSYFYILIDGPWKKHHGWELKSLGGSSKTSSHVYSQNHVKCSRPLCCLPGFKAKYFLRMQ